MSLNRSIAPDFQPVERVALINAEPVQLDNGLQFFVVNGGDQDIVRLELIFPNSGWDKSKPLQPFACNSMLVEGTSNLTSSEIAERVDYYGAFLQTDYNFDYSTLTLYTLNKHLKATLPIVTEVIQNSIFPEEELATFIRNQKQKLSVNLEKNDFLARRIFNNALFGDSIYGYLIDEQDYDKLQRSDLIDYFKKAYQIKNSTIILSGKVDESVINTIKSELGGIKVDDSTRFNNVAGVTASAPKLHFEEREDALQSAIRIGKVMVNRSHPDFPALQVLNTVLGGYFGSRLMANIREDKGYTYGIGSAVISLQNTGYFFIATEVGAEVTQAALTEIEKEIKLLQDELIGEEELTLVRNYMLGSLLGSLENAFSHADKFKNVYFNNLGYEYYDRYTEVVKSITAVELQALAKKYFSSDSMDKVIVGKM